MAENTKAWITGLIMGLIGVVISAAIFVYITLKSGTIFGLVAILCGAISGGAMGLGYKLAQGSIKSEAEVKSFLFAVTAFGFLGMLAAYFGPYLLFAAQGISFSLYFSLIGFGFMDFVFILIGAYGGRWAGGYIAKSIIYQHAVKQYKSEGLKQLDKKFK